MLGFDALGRNALGQVPGATTTTVFIQARVSAAARLKPSGTQTFALTTTIKASAFVKEQAAPATALSARAKAMAATKAPGGLILNARITAAAKAKPTPGYLLFAKMFLSSSALSDIHLDRKVSTNRNPLLLNSSSQFGASYWKGHNG